MNGSTTLVGLMGWPLNYTLSPAMHNSAYKALGLNFAYIPLRINPHSAHSLERALLGLGHLGFRGVNVTIPFKQQIIPYIQKLSPESKHANSVNTVLIDEDNNFFGHTTDGDAFMLDLKAHGIDDLRSMSIALLGAGGCAHALVFSLQAHGCKEIYIYNRNSAKAQSLITRFNNIKLINLDNIAHIDLVINCTPPESIFDIKFKNNQIIYDTNYMHDAINIKNYAQQAGSRFISGIGMLLYAGALSFEIFTGVKAPVDIMKKAL
jgi:shikimate dehydrogenase